MHIVLDSSFSSPQLAAQTQNFSLFYSEQSQPRIFADPPCPPTSTTKSMATGPGLITSGTVHSCTVRTQHMEPFRHRTNSSEFSLAASPRPSTSTTRSMVTGPGHYSSGTVNTATVQIYACRATRPFASERAQRHYSNLGTVQTGTVLSQPHALHLSEQDVARQSS